MVGRVLAHIYRREIHKGGYRCQEHYEVDDTASIWGPTLKEEGPADGLIDM